MDAQEQLVFGGEISVAVLGKGADFVLIELQGEIDEDATEDAREKGYTYCGVLGVKDGHAHRLSLRRNAESPAKSPPSGWCSRSPPGKFIAASVKKH